MICIGLEQVRPARRPSGERLTAQAAEGGARRRALSPIARDMDRCLGRMDIHADVPNLEALVAKSFGGRAPEMMANAED